MPRIADFYDLRFHDWHGRNYNVYPLVRLEEHRYLGPGTDLPNHRGGSSLHGGQEFGDGHTSNT